MSSRSKAGIAMAAMMLAFLLAAATAPGQQDKSITIDVRYADTPGLDDGNTGVTSADSAMDFTTASTAFSWQANESNLCTLWRVLPLDSETAAMSCNGAAHCCSFADVAPGSEGWNDTFFLYSGAYGVNDAALVSAKVVYADYQLGGQTYSDIAFSDWGTLTALFTSGSSGLSYSVSSQRTAITATSPSNSSALVSGEDIVLRATVNDGGSLVYSLDGSPNATMQGNTSSSQSNYTANISGVLSNGGHTIVLHAYENTTANVTARLEHPFNVSDNAFPAVTLSPAINSTAASSLTQALNVNITADETSNISYSLNSGSTTTAATAAKSASLAISPAATNTLLITAVDSHGNSHPYHYAFNFTYNGTGSCQDTVQNYHDAQNETGIDCGGPCAACVTFSVSTDKESYTPGQLVYVSVTARSDAQHNITITGPSYYTSFVYNGSTYYIISPPNTGLYRINVSLKYRNLTPDYISKQFTVNTTSSLSASIQANSTTIDQGETIAFTASVSGNTTTVSYKWDFNGDGAVDSTASGLNYTYAAPGSYAATLNVTEGSTTITDTETVTVRNFYNVTINLTDTRYQAIGGATATIRGSTKAAVPLADFQLSARSYSLQLNASGYKNKTETVTVGENRTFSFTIQAIDTTLPVIAIAAPGEAEVIRQPNATIKFTVQDETVNACVAYLNKAGTGWLARASTTVRDRAEQQLNVTGLENATYQLRIDCTDEESHAGSSDARQFSVELAQGQAAAEYNSSEDEAKVASMLAEINAVLAGMNSYNRLEQEAAETLKLEAALERGKTDLQRLIRDIRNVNWRNFNESDETAYLAEKRKAIDAVAANMTTGIAVEKTAKFVTYPVESDIKEAALAYLDSLGRKLTKKELDKLVKDSQELQQAAVITTDYKLVELKRRSGTITKATLIEKTIDFTGDTAPLMLIESIPKEIADSVGEVKFLFEYEVIKDDPVVSVTLPEEKKYAYYVEKELSQQQAQKTASVLLQREIKTEGGKSGGITGFAIFSGGSLLGDPGARLIAEIVIVVLLGAAYLAYSRGVFQKESRQSREFGEIVAQVRVQLQQNSYEKSKQLYSQVREAFKQLKPGERLTAYPTVSELHHELDAQYVKTLLAEANALLAQGRNDFARKAYERLNAVYKALPKEHKKGIFSQCAELHGKLGSAK